MAPHVDPFAVTDTAFFPFAFTAALAAPWLIRTISFAVYEVCVMWRRWHRKRHALDGYLLAAGQSLTSTAPRPRRAR